jgi:hypothetical protein
MGGWVGGDVRTRGGYRFCRVKDFIEPEALRGGR